MSSHCNPFLRSPISLFALILACSLGSGCAGTHPGRPARGPVAFEIEPWEYRGREGRQVTTEHYTIYTTIADEYLLAALTELLESSLEYYQQLVPPLLSPQKKMDVYLFASRPEWIHFTRAFTGPRAKQFLRVRHGGYSEQGVSVIQYTAHQTSFPLMAHEGFHQYLFHYVNPRVPAWLNEGLAVVCEGQRWKGTRIKAFDPWHNPRRRNELAEALVRKKTYPLRELLETHAGEVLARSRLKVSTYYGQLWALSLFLREGQDGKYAERFDRMLRSLAPEELDRHARAAHIWSDDETFHPGSALFRNFIGDDLESIEREYVEFMRQKVLGAH